MDKLLELPLDTLVVLGAGYMAYALAYTGLRAGHRPVDVAFLSLAFGLVAKAVLVGLDGLVASQIVSSVVAIVLALSVAAAWRKCGKDIFLALLRKAHVSYSDGLPSAWDSISNNTNTNPTQLSIELINGDVVWSEDLSKFGGEPFGPCLLGDDGSVALYVTSAKRAGESEYTDAKPRKQDNYWGSKITYIPANQIRRIAVRSAER